ncbi:MAG: hypothetical protein COB34_05655 [Methylophilaceae bacterium]|nr:MAG: hypothetical protein COB34_05655 [Methylophilaceae bacterium]
MKKISLSVVLLVGLFSANVAFAGCKKTLMGSDCESNGNGVSSHMRGNAVENTKAAKELKAAQIKARKAAKAIAKAQK